jgi:osmotically-inducible protein OsmY
MARHDYYDPDHAYRSRRLQRASDREELYRERPYGQRPMPGEYGNRERDRHITRQQADEEHSWSEPSAWYGEGRYRGVGPKGYVRSDERIRELVCDDLTDDPWVDASGIEVTVKDGEVTLSGTVSDRDAKRWAEDIAEHAGGVRQVQNNLRVV